MIDNVDQRGRDYGEIEEKFRPGRRTSHMKKYGSATIAAVGASARETAMRVAAGAVARKVLAGVGIRGALVQGRPAQDRPGALVVDEATTILSSPHRRDRRGCRPGAQGRLVGGCGDRGGRRRRAGGLGAGPILRQARSGPGCGADEHQRGQGRGDRRRHGRRRAHRRGERRRDRMGNDGQPQFITNRRHPGVGASPPASRSWPASPSR